MFLDELNNSSSQPLAIMPKQGMRYHVCGEVLEKKDFDTLKKNTWLNDKVYTNFLLLVDILECNYGDYAFSLFT